VGDGNRQHTSFAPKSLPIAVTQKCKFKIKTFYFIYLFLYSWHAAASDFSLPFSALDLVLPKKGIHTSFCKQELLSWLK
jgi:hypothetical protein